MHSQIWKGTLTTLLLHSQLCLLFYPLQLIGKIALNQHITCVPHTQPLLSIRTPSNFDSEGHQPPWTHHLFPWIHHLLSWTCHLPLCTQPFMYALSVLHVHTICLPGIYHMISRITPSTYTHHHLLSRHTSSIHMPSMQTPVFVVCAAAWSHVDVSGLGCHKGTCWCLCSLCGLCWHLKTSILASLTHVNPEAMLVFPTEKPR